MGVDARVSLLAGGKREKKILSKKRRKMILDHKTGEEKKGPGETQKDGRKFLMEQGSRGGEWEGGIMTDDREGMVRERKRGVGFSSPASPRH